MGARLGIITWCVARIISALLWCACRTEVHARTLDLFASLSTWLLLARPYREVDCQNTIDQAWSRRTTVSQADGRRSNEAHLYPSSEVCVPSLVCSHSGHPSLVESCFTSTSRFAARKRPACVTQVGLQVLGARVPRRLIPRSVAGGRNLRQKDAESRCYIQTIRALMLHEP